MVALLLLVILSIIAIGPQNIVHGAQHIYNKWMILTMIIEKIERFYIEQREPDNLVKNAIDGILNGLDPHSVYLTPEQYKEWTQNFDSFYQGIGLKYNTIDEKLVIVSLVEDGPAAAAGIRIGDRILQIEGRSIAKLKPEEISDLIIGPLGTHLRILVEREEAKELLTFSVPRENILIESIPCACLLNDSTGYIKISHFTDSTPTELDLAFAKLNSQGISQLMIDLRDNGGGTLNSGIAVADRLIPGGKLIAFTKGRAPRSSEQYLATDGKTFPIMPLILLVNEGTASDAEIVSGAVQDWDRGIVVGRQTFGKAMVQTEFPFQDGSALLLTTARYYTPLGRLIQREYDAAGQENSRGSGTPAAKRKTERRYTTPKERVVYGGGGIRPDVVIERPRTEVSESFQRLYYAPENFIIKFAHEQVSSGRLPQSDLASFIRDFEVTPTMLHQFRILVFNSGFNMSEKDFQENRDRIKFVIKREMAARIWGEDGRSTMNAYKDQEIAAALKSFGLAVKLLEPKL